jgi:YYY domain-containing protein
MFGPFLVAIAGLLTVLVIWWRRKGTGHRLLGSWLGWTAAFILVPLGLMLLIVLMMVLTPQGRQLLEGIRHIPAVYAIVGDEPWGSLLIRLLLVKLRTWLMPLIVAGMAALGMVLLQRSALTAPPATSGEEPAQGLHHPSVQFVLLCAVAGLLLTLSVEFFYLSDVFKVRANTIFKFYFQAWVLMAIASAFAIYWLGRRKSWLRLAFQLGFWVLFAMGMVYPMLGNISRAGNFERAGEWDHRPTLDGTAYLAVGQADDYDAIAWLNENVEGAPIILEKPGTGGSSYVYEGRVSALTGLPTLLGWAGHENQWRGNYDIQGVREPDILEIYNTLDPQAALTLLDEYDITYVYVGPLERSEYDPRALEKFGRFMDVVYENDGVTIYKVPKTQ